jgi:hypothetical protein
MPPYSRKRVNSALNRVGRMKGIFRFDLQLLIRK